MARDSYIQALRGVAISAVVFIHCLPQSPFSVAVRPLLNFAVALFIFLSGHLTTPERCGDVLGFYRRRIGKVLVPYLVWSLLYLLARRVTDPVAIGRAILVGGGGRLRCTTSLSTCSWCSSRRCCTGSWMGEMRRASCSTP